MAVTIDEIQVKFGAEITELQKRLDTVEGELDKTGKGAKRMGSFVKQGGAMAATALTGLTTAAILLGKESVKAFTVFEKSLSDLRAITGASTKDLEFYNIQARLIGKTTTLSAAEAAEAFKLIGSAKPDLLQSRDALVAVTKEAVTLAEAAGISLPEAASTLGITLNSLQLDASETSRVINVLAASAQKGAKEIPFVSAALSKFGGTAKSANVDIETSVAAIQQLGAAIPQAEIVGTSMRGILIALQQEAAKAGREFGGLVEELELLKPAQNDINTLVRIFGREQLLAAQTLLANLDNLRDLRTEITGTNTAYEQAAIRTDNLDGRIKELNSAYESLKITLGNLNKGPIYNFINNATKMTRAVEEMVLGVEQVTKNREIETFGQTLKNLGVQLDNFTDSDQLKQSIDLVTKRITEEREYIKLLKERYKQDERLRNTFGPRGVDARERAPNILNNITAAETRIELLVDTLGKLMDAPINAVNTDAEELTTTLSDTNEEASQLEKTLKAIGMASAIELDLELAKIEQNLGNTGKTAKQTGDSFVDLASSLNAALPAETLGQDHFLFLHQMNAQLEQGKNFTNLLSDSMMSLFSTLSSGGNIFEAFGNYLKQLAARLAAMAATAAILNVLSGGSGALAGGITSMFGQGAGFGGILAQLLGIGGDREMASGGIAYGPTRALIGEYPGARSNPEVVAPLNKLQGMLGGMGMNGNVTFRIEGNSLVGVLDRANRQRFRTS